MISWKLTYPDGNTHLPLDGSKGIKRAPRGAEYLILTRNEAPFMAIPLEGKLPIFCEVRHIEMGPEARPGGAYHGAYVLGRAASPEQIELWTIDENTGEVVPCPADMYEVAKNAVLNGIGALDG